MIIRTLTELALNLNFLIVRDDDGLWGKFRSYGSGQAKLAFLKMLEKEHDIPDYINLDELQMLANEDIWQEFTEIDLGSWSGKDLRRMSDEAGIKDIYDKYYPWPSGYVYRDGNRLTVPPS